MDNTKRATLYFDPSLHKALRLKAAQTERSLSDLVNSAVRRSLTEDADDLAAFDKRAVEPSRDVEAVVKDLKRRGKLQPPDQAFGGEGTGRASPRGPVPARAANPRPRTRSPAGWV